MFQTVIRNMKKLINILVLVIIIVGCQNPTEKSKNLTNSNFNLWDDYTTFRKSMTESDTIIVWMDMSVCLYQGMEKFDITKEKDSLKVQLYFKESAFSDKEYIEQKTIKIPLNDTIWNFEKFLIENKNRIKPNDKNKPNFAMYSDTSKLYFYTYGLSDLNRFIIDYCIAMRRLDPENAIYEMADYGEMEIEEEIEIDYETEK